MEEGRWNCQCDFREGVTWKRILEGYTVIKWLSYWLKGVTAREFPWYVHAASPIRVPITDLKNELARHKRPKKNCLVALAKGSRACHLHLDVYGHH